MTALDPLPVLICVALIAVLFAHAAVAKFTDLASFEQHLAAYGVPHLLQALLARALPGIEALAAIALLSPWRAGGALLAAALLLTYAGAMAWQRSRGRALDCGCGGAPLPVSWWLAARNVVLAGIAAVVLMPVGERGLGLADALVTAAAVLVATLLYAAFNQILRQFAAMRPAAAPR